jgi:hypothetical protein
LLSCILHNTPYQRYGNIVLITGEELYSVSKRNKFRKLKPVSGQITKKYHVRKIMDRKQRADIGKYSFVNRTIKNWNQLHAEALGTFPCKSKIFRTRVGKQL